MESIQAFARRLDGREYKHEIVEEEKQLAADLGYVIVFGCSDDSAKKLEELFRGSDIIGRIGGDEFLIM
ncbi:MAG: hypothetical protein RR614_03945, partial [Eubacterium sp.]